MTRKIIRFGTTAWPECSLESSSAGTRRALPRVAPGLGGSVADLWGSTPKAAIEQAAALVTRGVVTGTSSSVEATLRGLRSQLGRKRQLYATDANDDILFCHAQLDQIEAVNVQTPSAVAFQPFTAYFTQLTPWYNAETWYGDPAELGVTALWNGSTDATPAANTYFREILGARAGASWVCPNNSALVSDMVIELFSITTSSGASTDQIHVYYAGASDKFKVTIPGMGTGATSTVKIYPGAWRVTVDGVDLALSNVVAYPSTRARWISVQPSGSSIEVDITNAAGTPYTTEYALSALELHYFPAFE